MLSTLRSGVKTKSLLQVAAIKQQHKVFLCVKNATRYITIVPNSGTEEVSALVERARKAQKEIENCSQQEVDDLITAMVYAVAKEPVAKMIAQHTVDETRLGNYDGKFLKIFRKTRATLMEASPTLILRA